MRNKEIRSKIEDLEKQLAELKEEFNKSGEISKPELQDRYYFLQSTGQVRNCYNTTENSKNAKRIEMGNYFYNKADAEKFVNFVKYSNLLRKYIEEFDDAELDWDNTQQVKIYTYYNHTHKCICFEEARAYQIPGVIYASNETVLQRAIDYVGEDNVIKYIFGAE